MCIQFHLCPPMSNFGDASTSKVLGLGKVVISQDLTIEKVMLVESLAYNLLSVRQLAVIGFGTFFDLDTMALLWSKTLKVAFFGHVENRLYVVNFLEQHTKTATCLMAKVDVGWLASPTSPCQYEIFAKSPRRGSHSWTNKCEFCQRSCLQCLHQRKAS